ncbi:hypothetical protein RR48_03711 [Papilio machaon]|uniref:Uncharacterized protein n=1 Tax=Papilio machaon TaxID=76193 RepID=A0A0N1IGA9_PAPMA|nr:hypothetical protein RR48_03711 [Papilio machaon]
MEKLRFKFEVLASSDVKTNMLCITSIETPDGRTYEVPDDLKAVSKHTAILSSEVYNKIKNSLKKRHQTRSVWIPLDTNFRKIYLDAGENVQFGDQYLEEITVKSNPSPDNTSSYLSEKKNLGKAAERFLMERYSNKTLNAEQWINEFESECERFEIIQSEEKIETLKHLLEKHCLDWYSSMLIKLTVNSQWKVWRDNFCETFGNKGWSQIKYAFTFKYQAGSLLEYAIKKEKLLLDVNKQIDTQTMINLIVMGLPDHIIDKIDKETAKSTASLYNEISKHEYVTNKKDFSKNKIYTNQYKGKMDKIKPCKICENLNKGVRFHPEEKCWFRQTKINDHNRNSNKTVNNSVIDIELNNEYQKNE